MLIYAIAFARNVILPILSISVCWRKITPKSSAEQSIQGIIVLKIYNSLVNLSSELGVVRSEANKSYVTFCYFVYYTLSFVSI